MKMLDNVTQSSCGTKKEHSTRTGMSVMAIRCEFQRKRRRRRNRRKDDDEMRPSTGLLVVSVYNKVLPRLMV
jgi:hypothetical protein